MRYSNRSTALREPRGSIICPVKTVTPNGEYDEGAAGIGHCLYIRGIEEYRFWGKEVSETSEYVPVRTSTVYYTSGTNMLAINRSRAIRFVAQASWKYQLG
jgi:hypothetical protein